MSETASYGVRALQGLDRNEDKKRSQDVEEVSDANNSRGLDEGKVMDLRSVNTSSDDIYVATAINRSSYDRDDAYTRAITASGMTRSTTQPRDGDRVSFGSSRSHSPAPSGNRE